MENQKVDYLKEDPDIPNQRFCCLSFIEPRDQKVMTQKEVFMASKFISYFIDEYQTAKEFTSNPNNEITDEIKSKLDLSEQNITKHYKGYRKTHFTEMSNEFNKKHNPNEAITVSGVKVRGSYRNYEEAQNRANEMREFEPAVNVLVGQVGYWLPYDPENMEDIKANFREEKLNEIYGQRQEAIDKAKAQFDDRKQKMVDKNKQEQELKKKLFNSETHEERKEEDSSSRHDIVIVDEDEVPKSDTKSKPKPTPATKAGNMRVKRRKN